MLRLCCGDNHKMGLIKFNNPSAIAIGIIMLVVGVQILVQVLPTLITAFTNLSGVANLSFASFFGTGGVVLILLSVAVLVGVFKMLGFGGGKK